MKSVEKIEFLNSLENKVELQINMVVKEIQNLDEQYLLKRALNGGWSIAQGLDHLNRYGHYYLPRIKKALDDFNGTPKETFKGSWLGSYFTKMMDPRAGKRKIKAFRDYVPPEELDGHAVVAEFLDQQELLLAYLKEAKNVDLDEVRIPISIMKWLKLKLGDVFQFIIAHNERHLVQAGRNLPAGARTASYSKEK
ncbi:MAG TPA: DinB family protein [Cyclobacteriaceae bacterium]|nr:DinB family protein [Cyclobacteriaceae bacterium]